MKLTVTLLAATLSVRPLAVTAHNGCTAGLTYCGYNLKENRGWTDWEIRGACFNFTPNEGDRPPVAQVETSLFYCAGGDSNGASLGWSNNMMPCCGGCVNAGRGRNDHCA